MRNAILGFCAALVLVAAAAFIFRDRLFTPEQATAGVEAPAPAGGLGGSPAAETTQVAAAESTPEIAAPSVVGTWTTRLRSESVEGGRWTSGNDWTFHDNGQVTETGFPALPQERWSQRGRIVQFYSAEQNWNGTISDDGNTITGTSARNFQFIITRK